MGKSEKDKMLTGELYRASDPELVHERQRCRSVLQAFNAQQGEDLRLALLEQLLGGIGSGAFIQPPFACDYGYNLSNRRQRLRQLQHRDPGLRLGVDR